MNRTTFEGADAIMIESEFATDRLKREYFSEDYLPLKWEIYDTSAGRETLVASRATTQLEVIATDEPPVATPTASQ